MNASRPIPFDEIPNLKGLSFTGKPFTVEESDVENFHRATWLDRAYDAEAEGNYPDKLIEGLMSLSLLDAVSRFNMPLDSATCWGINYGYDRVRFTAPLYADDVIVPDFEFLEVKEKGDGFLILKRVTLTKEGAPKPALIAEWWGYVVPPEVRALD